jgi:hypothetical protein
MADTPTTPHDALFRAIFENPEAVRGELQAVLPSPLKELIGLAVITRVPGRFADERFRGLETDALFRVGFEGQPPWYVYVLFEHQSQPDPLMPWRLLQYMVGVWARVMSESVGQTRLPPILPVVLSNASQGWRGPRRLVEIIDAPDWLRRDLGAYIPDFRFVLDDLVEVPPEALRQRSLSPFAKLGLWLMQTARDRARLEREFPAWQPLLEGVRGSPRELFRLLVYLRVVANMTTDEVLALTRVQMGQPEDREMITARDIWLSSLTPEWRKEVEAEAKLRGMEQGEAIGRALGLQKGLEEGRAQGLEQGLAKGLEQGLEQGLERGLERGLEQGLEQGREQGLEQGREQGLEQGREQGLVAGQREALLTLLGAKFGALDAGQLDRVRSAPREDLVRWLPRVLTAEHVDEVFRD